MHSRFCKSSFVILIYEFLATWDHAILDLAQNRKTFSNSQASFQKELYLLFEKSGNFFHRLNIEIDLTLSPFVFVHFLRIPPPPSTINILFEWSLYLKQLIIIYRETKKEMEGVHDHSSAFMHLNVKTNS